MKGFLILLVVGAVTAIASDICITPWPYGVVYWIGEIPSEHEAFAEIAAHWVREVCDFWGLGVPRPNDDWKNPTKIHQDKLPSVKQSLGGKYGLFPIVNENAYFVFPPIKFTELEAFPIALIIFPTHEKFWEYFCVYKTPAAEGYYIAWPRNEADYPPPYYNQLLQTLMNTIEAPIISLPLNFASKIICECPGIATRTCEVWFTWILVHEIAHWAIRIWSFHHGVKLKHCFEEALAQYTSLSLLSPDKLLEPAKIHRSAAIFAQHRKEGLSCHDEVFGVDAYTVGLSLIDFLVRNKFDNCWSCFREKIPVLLTNSCEATLREVWEEWRFWLAGEVDPCEDTLGKNRLLMAAILLKPLFPQVLNMLEAADDEGDIQELLALIHGPIPEIDAQSASELRKRECLVEYERYHESRALIKEKDIYALFVLGEINEYKKRLAKAWEERDWKSYAETLREFLKRFRYLPPPKESME